MPREAIPTESLDKDKINPIAADAVSNQRAVLTWAAAPEIKAAQLETVEQSLGDRQIRDVTVHRELPLY
jgi:hypothetical protein